jgi:type VI secretion system protein ImpH
MGSELRNKGISLIEDLKQNAHKFSFEMASYIIESGSSTSFGKEASISHAPFRTISVNSFYMRAHEIEKIEEIDGIPTIFIERMSIAGLNAPLPTPYADVIFRRTKENDLAMAAFVNMFNSRLLGISYQISKRRYLCLQNHRNCNCQFLRTIAAFLGNDPSTMERRFSRVAYLFWTKEKSSTGLESLIASIFQFDTKVRQFQTIWCTTGDDNRLGDGKFKLGINSGLGNRMSTSSIGIDIELTHDSYSRVYQLLTSEKHIGDIKRLVRKYLGEFLLPRIRVKPKNVPPLILSTDKNQRSAILGKTSWFQSTLDNMDYATL